MAHCQNQQSTTVNLQCTQCKNSGYIPNSAIPKPWTKPQGKERTPISPMEQQPATLIPETTATATLLVMSTPSRGETPWLNTVLPSANLFIARSWPLPPNKGDSPIPAMQKMIESDPSKTENTPRKTTIPHPVLLVPRKFCYIRGPATANIMATSKS